MNFEGNEKIKNEGNSQVYIASPLVFDSGNVSLHEVLEFKEKPLNVKDLQPVLDYYIFFAHNALKKAKEYVYEYSAELTVYGQKGYTTSDLNEIIKGIKNDISTSDGFKIVSNYDGAHVIPFFEELSLNAKKDFHKKLEKIGETERFTYRYFEFSYKHGLGYVGKFKNGEWISVEEMPITDSLDKDLTWYNWNIEIDIVFDFDTYFDIVDELHDAVRKKLPDEVVESCMDVWNDGEPGRVCSGEWNVLKLSEVQDYLDEINSILESIRDCCAVSIDGKWFCMDYPFGVASVIWTDDGFKIVGAFM